MGDIRKAIFHCPECNKEIPVEMWETIEMPYDSKVKKKIMTNTFFKVNCTDCNIAIPIGYKCLYNDMERRFMIWLSPKMGVAEQRDIQDYNDELKNDLSLRWVRGGYQHRVVRNDNEFREKIFIFEEGLDDRFIETMKLIYVNMLRGKLPPEDRIMGIYLDKSEKGEYRWVVIFNDKKPMIVDFDMNMYEDMKEKLHDLAEEKTPEGFFSVDPTWAMEILMTRTEGQKNPEQ